MLASNNISAFTIKVNNPNVNKLIGSVNINNNGRMIAFKKPIIKLAKNKDQMLVKFIPGTKNDMINNVIKFRNQRRIMDIYLSFFKFIKIRAIGGITIITVFKLLIIIAVFDISI